MAERIYLSGVRESQPLYCLAWQCPYYLNNVKLGSAQEAFYHCSPSLIQHFKRGKSIVHNVIATENYVEISIYLRFTFALFEKKLCPQIAFTSHLRRPFRSLFLYVVTIVLSVGEHRTCIPAHTSRNFPYSLTSLFPIA